MNWMCSRDLMSISPPYQYCFCTGVLFTPVTSGLDGIKSLSSHQLSPCYWLISVSLCPKVVSLSLLQWTVLNELTQWDHALLVKLLVVTYILSNSLVQDVTSTISLPCTQLVNSETLYFHPSFPLTTNYPPLNAICLGISHEVGLDFGPLWLQSQYMWEHGVGLLPIDFTFCNIESTSDPSNLSGIYLIIHSLNHACRFWQYSLSV